MHRTSLFIPRHYYYYLESHVLFPCFSSAPEKSSEHKDSAVVTPEQPAPRATEVPRASSPASIKADQILHKELLAETGLEVAGKVRFYFNVKFSFTS